MRQSLLPYFVSILLPALQHCNASARPIDTPAIAQAQASASALPRALPRPTSCSSEGLDRAYGAVPGGQLCFAISTTSMRVLSLVGRATESRPCVLVDRFVTNGTTVRETKYEAPPEFSCSTHEGATYTIVKTIIPIHDSMGITITRSVRGPIAETESWLWILPETSGGPVTVLLAGHDRSYRGACRSSVVVEFRRGSGPSLERVSRAYREVDSHAFDALDAEEASRARAVCRAPEGAAIPPK